MTYLEKGDIASLRRRNDRKQDKVSKTKEGIKIKVGNKPAKKKSSLILV